MLIQRLLVGIGGHFNVGIMKKIDINYNLLLFLYAYLRHVDLSLDRSRWGLWDELKKYYRNQIDALEVINKLLQENKLKSGDDLVNISIVEPSFLIRAKDFFIRLTIRKHKIYDMEILYCFQLLVRFDYLLKSDYSNYSLEAEKLRVDISKFYSFILAPKISKYDLDIAMKVEHFMQNEIHKTIKIKTFYDNISK